MNAREAQLASQTTRAESRKVSLLLQQDGSIQVSTLDVGPTALRTWGSDDYEFWVTVPPDAVGALAFELLRERLNGKLDGTDCLTQFCEANGVSQEWGSWP